MGHPGGGGRTSVTSGPLVELSTSSDPPAKESPSRRPALLGGLVVLIGAALSLLRTGAAGYGGVVWAEDGAVFLKDAYAAGGWGAVFSPYAGYLHVTSRTIVAAVSYLPIGWHGVAVGVSAVVVQAALALYAFNVVRANTRGWFAPAVATVAVLLVPVGGETVANIANLQWYLLFAGAIAPLWGPRRWPGRGASIVVMLALTTSCPFGGIAVGVAAVAWLIKRSRFGLTLLAIGLVGSAIQAIAMLHAPPRTESLEPRIAPLDLAHGYAVRVLGDGVFGVHFYDLSAPSGTAWTGVVVFAGLGVLAALAVRVRGLPALVVPAILGATSFVCFAAPIVLTDVNWRIPTFDSRYYVAPSLLVAAAATVLLGQLPFDRAGRGPRHWAAVLAAVIVVGSFAFGWVTSYREPSDGRDTGPHWASEIHRARAACQNGVGQHSSAGLQVPVSIAPRGWVTLVPCSRLSK